MKRKPSIFLFALFLTAFLFSCSVFSRESNDLSLAEKGTGPQWKHEWSRGAVFYEIFVRSFSDSNGDGIGDLHGLISKLDYLNDGKPETTEDLGIDAIWLMPVFESPSYHGYDVTDYRKIETDYGSNADFERLLAQAHRRGIRVIVDLVMNHSSSDHPWFVESSSSADSPRRDWYVWRRDNPGWTQPWGGSGPTWHPKNGEYFYGVFWSGMPDLNFRNREVRQEIYRTAAFWLRKGVDGFRLDATRYLVESGPRTGQADIPETHMVLKRLSKRVRKVKPESVLVGENWTETPIIATYYGSVSDIAGGDELPMNFNFPLSSQILQGILEGNGAGIASKIAEIQSLYPPGTNDAPFLTNHDQVRLATQLKKDASRLRLAASVLLTLPGSPFLYYGEEVGLENGPADEDQAKRTPMPWNDTSGGGFTSGRPWYDFAPGRKESNVAGQINKADSLLSHYRSLIHARKTSPALSKGDLKLVTGTTGRNPVIAFIRSAPLEDVMVLHNLGDSFLIAGPFPLQAIRLEKAFSTAGVPNPSGTPGQWTFPMPPRSSAVWRILN